jgi:hypothetical protein
VIPVCVRHVLGSNWPWLSVLCLSLLLLRPTLHLTDVSLALKLGRLVLFSCIDPPCIGIRWWAPEKLRDWERVWWLESKNP